jgi:hypothetical protein
VSEEGPKNGQRPQPSQSKTVLSTTAWQAVAECQVQDKKASQQFLPPSHLTPEQGIKWLPGLFALCASPNPSFSLLLLSVYHICTVTLAIHSCTYVHTTSIGPTNQCSRKLANWAICIVSHHPPPTNHSLRYCYSLFIIYA